MWQKLLVGLLILSGIYLLIRILKKNSTGTGKVTNVPDRIAKAFNEQFNNSDFKSLKENWLAVSKMETGGWDSKLFINGLNLWGMKMPKKRPTTAIGKTFGVAGRDQVGTLQKLFPNVAEIADVGIKQWATNPNNTGTQSDWASYANLNDAVKDIILWMDYTKFPRGPLSLRDHIAEMKKRSYFQEDIDYYTNAVIAWIQR